MQRDDDYYITMYGIKTKDGYIVKDDKVVQVTNKYGTTFERHIRSSEQEKKDSIYSKNRTVQVNGREYKEIRLDKREYAMVMSYIPSQVSKEQLNRKIFEKPIGDFIYTFLNKGNFDFRIIGREKIE